MGMRVRVRVQCKTATMYARMCVIGVDDEKVFLPYDVHMCCTSIFRRTDIHTYSHVDVFICIHDR